MHPKRENHRDKVYEAWIKKQQCVARGCRRAPCDPHHVDHARNNDYLCLPLCRHHHTFGADSYHVLERNGARRGFEEHHRVNCDEEIIRHLIGYYQEKFEAALNNDIRWEVIKFLSQKMEEARCSE